MNEKEMLLECQGMVKHFGVTKAVNSVDFSLNAGEIRGLIGENGSGKSTLCSMISGILHPDQGKMFLNGKPYAPSSTIQARQAGVSILLQECGTINGLSVAANIFLGKEGQFKKFGLVDRRRMEQEVKRCAQMLNMELSPGQMIDALSFEERKLVEVVRAVQDDPQILIVDETTTALTQKGREQIYRIMRQMKERGKSVIFITHDLEELLANCDTITVLRDGCLVETLSAENCSEQTIREKMIGRSLEGSYYRSADSHAPKDAKAALRAADVSYGSSVRHVSFELYEGEILGVGGLSECGMHDLGKLVFGALQCDSGSVAAMPDETVIKSPQQAMKQHIAYIPKDRDAESIMLNASIQDNITLASYDMLLHAGLIDTRSEKKLAAKEAEQLSVKMQGIQQKVKALSGGNKQKVAIAKWLANGSRILVLDCPTRGIDIGVKAAIYDLMEQLRQSGCAILMISEELPELIGMSDRLMIMKDGSVSCIYPNAREVKESQAIQQMI